MITPEDSKWIVRYEKLDGDCRKDVDAAYVAVEEALARAGFRPKQDRDERLLGAITCYICAFAMNENEPDREPVNAVKACPECETPNQFGELCTTCRLEHQLVASVYPEPRDHPDADGVDTMLDHQ